MKQHAHRERRSAKVVHELPLGFWWKDVCGLDLQQDGVVYDHVDTLRRNAPAFVPYWHRYFSANASPSLNKFNFESVGANTLEKPVSQRVVDLEKRANHVTRRFALDE